MRTPSFWDKSFSIQALLLQPLVWLYAIGFRLRWWWQRRHAKTPPLPTVCIGNWTVGGTGKTPLAYEIAMFFAKEDIRAAVVTRGYKGDLRGPILVDLDLHTPQNVGDEPLMLVHQGLTVIVAKDRWAGLVFAKKAGFEVAVCDDGLQDGRILYTLTIGVIHPQKRFSNGFMLPAGPLRCSPALCPADIICGPEDILPNLPHLKTKPTLRCDLPHQATVLVFTGIGNPVQVLDSALSLDLDVRAFIPYGDHHFYTAEDLDHLAERAEAHHAKHMLTTHKDWVRLPHDLRDKVAVLDYRTPITNPEVFWELWKKHEALS